MTTDAAPVTRAPEDAAELIEILDFLRDWFDRDRNVLDLSVTRAMGLHSLASLRDDLSRMIDTLGGVWW